MAIAKTPIILIAAAVAAPGSTKQSPALTGQADVRGHYGGLLTYAITNGATAPAAAVVITFQISADGLAWRDLWTVGGDIVAGSNSTNSIDLPRAAMYVRAVVYGNTVQPVTVAIELQAITAL